MGQGNETSTVDFACPLAGQRVQIRRDYRQNVSRTGKRMGRELAGTDCSNKDHCGIASGDAAAPVYDWLACVYLHPAGR
jgi:hypothetical protein